MKYVEYILLGIIMICLLSCGKNKNVDSNVIFVDVDVEQLSPLSEFISAERHICLETNDSCLLSGVGFLGMSDDRLVVENNYNFYIFDRAGKYINSFNHHGQGPGDYTGVSGVRVYDDEVYVMDNNTHKIFKYSFDGELVNEIDLDYSYCGFDVKSKDRIILASGYTNDSMSQFVVVDSNTGEALTKICPYDNCQTFYFWDYLPFSGKKDDDIYVNIPFSQCTYRIGENALDSIVSYHFDTQLQLPEYDLESMDIRKVGKMTQNANIVRNLGFYYPSKVCDYLTYTLFGQYGLKTHLLKFDKNGQQLAQRMINDFDEIYPYFNDVRGIVDGEIICIRSADSLLSVDELTDRSYWKDQGLTEESNPVVFFYKLKES